MRKRNAKTHISLASALMALALLTGCAAEPLPAPEPTEAPAAPAVEILTTAPAEEPTLALRDDAEHPALMEPMPDGRFHPDAPLTRAELCRLLRPLLTGLSRGSARFADLRVWDADFRNVAVLYCAGLLPDEEGAAFRPEAVTERGYLAGVLDRLANGLGGEEASRARTLAMDVRDGITDPRGAESTGVWISRRETAVVLERLTGREPDGEELILCGVLPPDMTTEDAAWDYVADALKDYAGPPEPGVHRAGGWLYAAWDDGTMVTDMDYGVWTFGPDGRYTTGDQALDAALAAALEASGANSLEDPDDALRAAYLYIKYNFEYMVRPEDTETIPVGRTGWEYERAERFFRYGGGTCYGYAAALCLMARALGYHAYAVAAEVNQFYGAHGFVVIPEGENDYIYDVELEATRPERHRDFDLYHILNYEVYNYWYVSNWRVD